MTKMYWVHSKGSGYGTRKNSPIIRPRSYIIYHSPERAGEITKQRSMAIAAKRVTRCYVPTVVCVGVWIWVWK